MAKRKQSSLCDFFSNRDKRIPELTEEEDESNMSNRSLDLYKCHHDYEASISLSSSGNLPSSLPTQSQQTVTVS